MKKIIALLFAAVMCLSLIACGGGSSKDNTWPDRGLGSMLPEPDAKKIHIGYNLDDSFSADIQKAKEEDFIAYVVKCKEAGFTVDIDSDFDDYIAYNAEGYQVSISFYDSLESVSIMLRTPKVNGTIAWPIIGLATLLPTPDTNVGTISIDTSSQFVAWIGKTSFDDYKAYVNLCIDSGFDIDYNNDEKVFTADNAEGVSLRLEYEGFDTMYIQMYAPKDNEIKTEDIETNESKETSQIDTATSDVSTDIENGNSSELVDGMRPEFKEALDSYEAFFNEYCEFMEKYAENPTDLELVVEYADYMTQYADTVSKMENLDDGTMNDAETKYYIEVTGRITQKLLEVSSTIK